jgi:hypothetical protein
VRTLQIDFNSGIAKATDVQATANRDLQNVVNDLKAKAGELQKARKEQATWDDTVKRLWAQGFKARTNGGVFPRAISSQISAAIVQSGHWKLIAEQIDRAITIDNAQLEQLNKLLNNLALYLKQPPPAPAQPVMVTLPVLAPGPMPRPPFNQPSAARLKAFQDYLKEVQALQQSMAKPNPLMIASPFPTRPPLRRGR